MAYGYQIKGNNHLRYTFKPCKKSGLFEIIDYIREYVTLFQLLEIVGNVSHDVSIDGNWIFHSNKKPLQLVNNHWILFVLISMMMRCMMSSKRFIMKLSISIQSQKSKLLFSKK